MLNKRGQFFILTAVILSTIVIGLTTTKNYVKIYEEPQEFFDLTYELEEETGRVIDYGIYEKEDRLGDFLKQAAEEMNSQGLDIELTAIYEDPEGEISILTYTNIEDSIEMNIDNWSTTTNINSGNIKEVHSSKKWPTEKEATITMGNKTITITPKSGEKFYIILGKKTIDSQSSETYTQTSKGKIKVAIKDKDDKKDK